MRESDETLEQDALRAVETLARKKKDAEREATLLENTALAVHVGATRAHDALAKALQDENQRNQQLQIAHDALLARYRKLSCLVANSLAAATSLATGATPPPTTASQVDEPSRSQRSLSISSPAQQQLQLEAPSSLVAPPGSTASRSAPLVPATAALVPLRRPPVNEVVRKRAERDRLPAHYCEDCEKFFNAAGYARDAPERASVHEYCSRHRHKVRHVETPDGFWGFGFGSESESRGTPGGSHELVAQPAAHD